LKNLTLIKQHDTVLQLTWFINNICTNHCDYCPTSLHNGTNHHYDWKHARSFLTRLMDRYKKINCIFLGGEPTVSPFLNEAIDMLHSRGHTMTLTSNGVRSVEYWKNIAPKVNSVSFSYHPAYGIEDFFEKVEVISKHTWNGVKVMFDSRHWDKAMEVYNQCIKLPYLNVSAARILTEIAAIGYSWGAVGDVSTIGANYTAEQLAWLAATPNRPAAHSEKKIKKMYWGSAFYYDDGSFDQYGDANRLISADKSFFKGWACSIGLESLFINWNGQVKKGNCRQPNTDLFHIDNHYNHPLPTSGEICVMERCTCPTDVYVTKFPVNAKNVPKPYPVIPLTQNNNSLM